MGGKTPCEGDDGLSFSCLGELFLDNCEYGAGGVGRGRARDCAADGATCRDAFGCEVAAGSPCEPGWHVCPDLVSCPDATHLCPAL